MHRNELDAFSALLDEFAVVFGKPKPDDLVVQRYWNALKDQSLEAVTRARDRHMRYGKFFPKPVDLRPKDDKPPPESSSAHDAAVRAAIAYNARTWKELRRLDPDRCAYEHGMAAAARAMAASAESSPVYAEALREFNHCLDRRRAAWDRVRAQQRLEQSRAPA